MAIDTAIVSELEQIARKLETKAGIMTGIQTRDTEVVSKLRRIRDSLDSFISSIEEHSLLVHTDVSSTLSPNDGDFFRYSSSISAWINDTADLNDLSDVTVSGPSLNDLLVYTGSQWSNGSIGIAALEDVNLSIGPFTTDSQLLVWEPSTKTWGNRVNTISSIADVGTGSETADDLLQWNGTRWVNRDFATCGLLDRDGTIELTGDWDAGDYIISAKGFRTDNTAAGASFDNHSNTINVTPTASGAGEVYRGALFDIDYDYNNGAGLDSNRICGIELDIDATSSAVVFSAATPQLIKGVITNDASTAYSTVNGSEPVSLKVQNLRTSQTFPQGAFLFGLEAGGTSGNCIGTRSFISASGSGDIRAYQGYFQGLTGYTGDAVGLEAFGSLQSGMTSVTGVSSLPQALGTGPTQDLIMAFRGDDGQWLASRGSLFVTSTQRATPNAFASTHLTHTAAGSIYAEEDLEIDGTAYFDGDIDHNGSNIGFFGAAPTAQPAAYTPTNVTTDRSYDANSTTVTELADVLGTLIADLQSLGLVG